MLASIIIYKKLLNPFGDLVTLADRIGPAYYSSVSIQESCTQRKNLCLRQENCLCWTACCGGWRRRGTGFSSTARWPRWLTCSRSSCLTGDFLLSSLLLFLSLFRIRFFFINPSTASFYVMSSVADPASAFHLDADRDSDIDPTFYFEVICESATIIL